MTTWLVEYANKDMELVVIRIQAETLVQAYANFVSRHGEAWINAIVRADD